jgi:hypothetical protein
MVYIAKWEEFRAAAEELYTKNPEKVVVMFTFCCNPKCLIVTTRLDIASSIKRPRDFWFSKSPMM